MSGFTMMEMVIVLGVFGIFSYVAFNAMTDADTAQSTLQRQLAMRQVLDRTIAEVSEESGFFMALKEENGVYFACYDREGKRKPSKFQSIEYGITFVEDLKIPTKDCLGSKFMVYVKPFSGKHFSEVYVFAINEKTAKKQRSYKRPIKVMMNRGF